MDLKHRLLWETFGYTEFRPGQLKLIDAMLAGRDVLGVMPTGAGKSICYQMAGMLLRGVTLVISPLISLMQDQVTALQRAGISACFINSSQSAEERRDAIAAASAGRCKLIYIAPERLEMLRFHDVLHKLKISMVAVDEAHCISQWGHDFRPSYRRIPQFLESLPERPVISAFTATATAQVREDIIQSLHLHQPERLITSFDRPNLYYEVRRPYDREKQLLRFVQEHPGQCGIIYCLTRKKTEELAQYLCDNQIPAAAYHAGLDAMTRRAVQRKFLSGEIPVITATNAFGMGINKADVRFVVHFGMPRNLESYYQEAGRAGRDGEPAHCLMLFDEADIGLHEYLIRQDPENPALTDEKVAWLKKQNLRRLEQMKRYVFTEQCLRQHILAYFGQDAPDFCGQCSNCESTSVEKDITTDAQKILSCVYRVKEQCDAEQLCDILRGEPNTGYESVSTFGIMRDTERAEILTEMHRLVGIGCLVRQENPSRLSLTAAAKPILFENKRVTLRVRADISAQEQRLARESRASDNPQLSRELREFRKNIAKLRGKPAFSIFSDTILEKLVQKRPQTAEQLEHIAGTADLRGREKEKLLQMLRDH